MILDNNQAFQRLTVDNIMAGGARISWEMNRHFIDPGPYSFQLQFGHTGLDTADDWIDVGAPVVDTYFTFDMAKRAYGKTLDPHYRIELTTSVGIYLSDPEECSGHLIKRDWLNAREVIRKEQLRHTVLTSPVGYLLKARRYGPKCPICLDQFTEEVSRSKCTTCFGTGFEFGYFDPLPACYADVGMDSNREHRNANRGMEKQDTISARFIGDPQLYSYDAWVNGTSDERYYLHTIKSISQIRGVCIIYEVELRLAPFSDIIYTIPVEPAPMISPKSTYNQEKQLWREKRQKNANLNYLDLAIAEAKAKKVQTRLFKD